VGDNCSAAHFIEGVLKAGGGDAFDIVSFHAYVHYNGTLDWDLYHPMWGPRGGAVQGKADFLREVMARYSVDKPLFHTEAALICSESSTGLCDPPDATFFQKQADYVVRLYARNWADGFLGTIWYRLDGPGWRNGSLLDENQDPRPAYYALDFMTEELWRAEYLGPVQDYAHLEGYAFATKEKRIWVLWSRDEQAIIHITPPAQAYRVMDKYGGELPLGGVQFSGSEPVYIELPR
jgi:hypothetical protein